MQLKPWATLSICLLLQPRAQRSGHPQWCSLALWHLPPFPLLLPLSSALQNLVWLQEGKGFWKVVQPRMIWTASIKSPYLQLYLSSALLVWLPEPHIKLQRCPLPDEPQLPVLSKCYQHLGDLFNITLVKWLLLLEPRQHASLFFRESQEKLLKMCLKLHIPRSPWQRSFAKLVKRAGENSTAHFWVYGYYFACAAELIECDFGHPWSKGKRLRRFEALHQSSRDGYHFGYSPHLLYSQTLEKMRAKETETKKKGIK